MGELQMKIQARYVSTFLLLVGAQPALAQVTIPEEYGKTVQTRQVVGALGSDLFGDTTSFYTGATSFSIVDVSLPGNNALPVEIRRSFSAESRDGMLRNQLLGRDGSFAEWELDIPYLHGIFSFLGGWQVGGGTPSNMRCSLAGGVDAEPPEYPAWIPSDYWHGNSLHLPGGGEQEILLIDSASSAPKPTDGKTYVWLTNGQWYFSCLPATANGIAGDAFLAVDPQGSRYYFNWIVKRQTSEIRRPGSSGGTAAASTSSPAGSESKVSGTSAGNAQGTASDPQESSVQSPVEPGQTLSLGRSEVRIFPTKIEDRIGNYVTYTYDSANPWRLLSIVASDGRSLTLSYNTSGQISSVTDGTRTWTYIYGNGLTEVRLPDQTKWLIDFSNLRTAYTTPAAGSLHCEGSGASTLQYTYTGTMTHPSGAVGEFKFKSLTHGRSYVPKRCIPPESSPSTYSHADVPFLFNTVAITEKKISGPGMSSPSIWTYTYGPPNNSWLENCGGGCTSTKTVEVVGPGEWTRYTFGNRYKYNEGKLLTTETGSGPLSILQTQSTTYLMATSGQAYPDHLGWSLYSRGDHMAEWHFPAIQRTTVQQGRSFTWQVATGCAYGYCFDQFARPTKVIKSSAP